MTAFLLHLDPIYWVILGVGLLLTLGASATVKMTFARYEKVRSRSGITGAQVAQAILQANGIHDVRVEPVAGRLSDHYDPRSKVLRLSEPVYHSDSVAALGVAAHEVGHAIQHSHRYKPLAFRSAWVPVASIGSGLGETLIVIGLILSAGSGNLTVAWIGLVLFAATTVFTLVTVPVELDASKRAMVTLQQAAVLDADELPGARKVLNAAALTYVAAAAASLLLLAYWAYYIFGRGRDD